MPDVREKIEIDATPEAVWDVVMDPDRLGDWVTANRSVTDVPDLPLGEGDSFKQELKVAGKKFGMRWTLVEAQKPSLAVWKAKGPSGTGADVRYELSEIEGGTRFDYVNDFDLPGGPLNLVGKRIAGKPATKAAQSSLKNLKALLEK